MKLELEPMEASISARAEMRSSEANWRETLKTRVATAKRHQRPKPVKARKRFIAALIAASVLGAAWSHNSHAAFAFDIASVNGHHDYVSRYNDICDGFYLGPADVNIGCGTVSHTQPIVQPLYNPKGGTGEGTILIFYTHSEAHGGQPLIIEFYGCALLEGDSKHAIASCDHSSDDGFVDGFQFPIPYPIDWENAR